MLPLQDVGSAPLCHCLLPITLLAFSIPGTLYICIYICALAEFPAAAAPQPVWEELEEQHEDSKTLVVGTVDCSTDGPFCNKHAVPGLPTIMTFHPPDREGLSYEGGKSLEELQVFARKLSAACDVSALASCSAEQREELRPYLDMPIPELRKKARRIKESLATAHYQMEKGRQAMVALEGAPGGRKGSAYKEAEAKWENLQRALKLMQIKVANSYRPMRAVLAALPKEEQEAQAEASTTIRSKKRRKKRTKDEV